MKSALDGEEVDSGNDESSSEENETTSDNEIQEHLEDPIYIELAETTLKQRKAHVVIQLSRLNRMISTLGSLAASLGEKSAKLHGQFVESVGQNPPAEN